MPRTLGRTPEWLTHPSPGHQLFAESSKASNGHGRNGQSAYTGPLKKIAKGRGTEVFVASGNELRWADLQSLKDDFELDGEPQGAYRVRVLLWVGKS
jgi:nucleoporin NUP82